MRLSRYLHVAQAGGPPANRFAMGRPAWLVPPLHPPTEAEQPEWRSRNRLRMPASAVLVDARNMKQMSSAISGSRVNFSIALYREESFIG